MMKLEGITDADRLASFEALIVKLFATHVARREAGEIPDGGLLPVLARPRSDVAAAIVGELGRVLTPEETATLIAVWLREHAAWEVIKAKLAGISELVELPVRAHDGWIVVTNFKSRTEEVHFGMKPKEARLWASRLCEVADQVERAQLALEAIARADATARS